MDTHNKVVGHLRGAGLDAHEAALEERMQEEAAVAGTAHPGEAAPLQDAAEHRYGQVNSLVTFFWRKLVR